MSAGHAAGVTVGAVSADGSFFVSASRDNTLKLWSSTTGEVIRTLAGHPDEVMYCAVGPDNRVYSAGPTSAFDAIVKIWDPATGSEVASWELRNIGEIRGLAVSPPGDFVACLGATGYLEIRDPITGEKLHEIDVGGGMGRGVCTISRNGAFVIVDSGGELRAIDPATGDVVSSFQGHGVQALGLTPDASSVLFVEMDKGWAIGDIASGASSVIADDDLFSACAISPDGALVAACISEVTESWNSITGGSRVVEAASVRIRRMDSGEITHDLDLKGEEAAACAFLPDGSLVLAAGARALKVWDVESGEEIGSIPLEAETTCLIAHPSLAVAALGDAVGGFQVLDLGIELGRIVVTAEDRGSGATVRCPACNQLSPSDESIRGQDAACPSCGIAWRVNPFVLSFLTEQLRPAESEEAPEEKARRLAQARNRAIFTAGSIEDLAALAQEEQATPPATQAPRTPPPPPPAEPKKRRFGLRRRSRVEAPSQAEEQRPSGAAARADKPGGLTALNDQVKGMLLEEVAEAGIDLDTFPPDIRLQFLAASLSMSLMFILKIAPMFMDPRQNEELQRIADNGKGDAGEIIQFLDENLPEGEAVESLRGALKNVIPQVAEMARNEMGQKMGRG